MWHCRDSSTETILWLAHQPDVNMSGMLPAFTRPVKNQSAWRPVYGRLQLVTSLVPLFGVSKGGEGGFQLEPLMKFVGSAFTSANAEVRSQAVKVTLLLYSKVGISHAAVLCSSLFCCNANAESRNYAVLLSGICCLHRIRCRPQENCAFLPVSLKPGILLNQSCMHYGIKSRCKQSCLSMNCKAPQCNETLTMQVGVSVQKYLPDDLNPKIKEQLDIEMGGGQGVGPPPVPPPAASSSAAPAPARKQAANASRKKNEGDKSAQQQAQQAAAAQRAQPQAQDHAIAGMPLWHVLLLGSTPSFFVVAACACTVYISPLLTNNVKH